MRTAFFFLLLLSVASAAAAAEAQQQPEATPAAEAAAAATEAPVEEELPPLDCKTNELLEKAATWSVDCVALWLENLGFPELRGAFIGNKVDGAALQTLTLKALKDDYGVSDEDQRKKIYYNLKDVVKKDNATGNTNNWAEMFFWCLPFLGVYKWITLKYDKQIAKAMKRYQKWQEVRAPAELISLIAFVCGSSSPGSSSSHLTRVSSRRLDTTGPQPAQARRAGRLRRRHQRVDLRRQWRHRREEEEGEEGTGREEEEAAKGRVEEPKVRRRRACGDGRGMVAAAETVRW